MASGPCAYCGEEGAQFFLIIGDEPGRDIGGRCLAGLGLELAREVLTPEAIWGVIGPMFVEGGADGAARPKRPARARKGKVEEPAEPAAEPAAAAGLEESPAAAQDA